MLARGCARTYASVSVCVRVISVCVRDKELTRNPTRIQGLFRMYMYYTAENILLQVTVLTIQPKCINCCQIQRVYTCSWS